MQIRGFVRTIKDGGPVPDGTEVRIYSHETQALLQTVATVGGEYSHNFQGNPGPYWVEVEHAGEVHLSSSKVIGMAGPVNIGGIPLLFRLWHDGYIPDVLDDLLVISSGVGMSVTVGAGAALVRGVLYDQSEPLPLAIGAADSQKRIDLVVLQISPAGSHPNTEGRARVLVKRGTPGSSPSAPGLTQSQNVWEIPLANVVVDPGVSSIAASKVVDRRTPSNVKIGDGYITTSMIADQSVTGAKIAPAAVGHPHLADDSVYERHIVNGHVTGAKIAPLAVTDGKIASNSIFNRHITDGSIEGSHLRASVITSREIADGAVIQSRVADDAIGSRSIASNVIHSHHIDNRSIINRHMADNSVYARNILNGHITEEKLSPALRNKLGL